MVDIDTLVRDIKNGIRLWIDRHDYEWFARSNYDMVLDAHYHNWLDEHCPHGWHEHCDCNVPKLSENDIESSLKQWYNEFCLDFTIVDIMEEMQSALVDLSNNDPNEVLAAFVFAIHLNHVHGSIIDYCRHIDRPMVDSISQSGLSGTFGQDAVDEFVNSHMVF